MVPATPQSRARRDPATEASTARSIKANDANDTAPRQSCRAPRFSRETEGIREYVAFLLTTEAEKAQRLQAASRGPRS